MIPIMPNDVCTHIQFRVLTYFIYTVMVDWRADAWYIVRPATRHSLIDGGALRVIYSRPKFEDRSSKRMKEAF